MAGGPTCSLTCNVKDVRTGKVKVSALWDNLSKFFKGDRKDAVAHYFLTKDNNFLIENSDVLQFDADGEVTISSLKKALERDGEYTKLSNNRIREHLNQELKAGVYEYSEALDNILKFNKQNNFKDDLMATMRKDRDGKYAIEVVPRNSSEEYALAEHVQNKLITDAIMEALRDRGLSVEFLKDSKYAVQYVNPGDGLMAVAQVVDGVNTSKEVAEAAGHFIVAAMQNDARIQRLIKQMTPEVQEALFKDKKSDVYREEFLVSDESAMEAAGILLGRELIRPFQEAQASKSAKSAAWWGVALPRAIKWLLSKCAMAAKKVFGTYKPADVEKMVQNARYMASTAADGFISNPELLDTNLALSTPATYTGTPSSKMLSEAVKTNVKAYNDTMKLLKDAIYRLDESVKRAQDPLNAEIKKKLKQLTKDVNSKFSEQLTVEAFAQEASLSGMIYMLEGVAQILDTDVRALLDSIQPSDRISAKTNTAANAKSMRTINTTIKNICEIYSLLKGRLDTLSNSNEKMQFQDASEQMISESLREALNRLADVLVGKEEVYEDVEGQTVMLHGLQELMEAKRRQIYVDALKDFWGSDYIELNAGKVWKQRGKGPKRLTTLTEDEKHKKIADFASALEEDITWFDRYLCSAADCGDFITACSAKVVKRANIWSDRVAARFLDNVIELRTMMEDAFGTTDCTMFYETMEVTDVETDEFGNETRKTHTEKTGNLVSRVNNGAWERDRQMFKKELKTGFKDYLAKIKKQFYENNKGTNERFNPTDEQLGILYHAYVEPLWEEWHKEHSEKDTSIPGKERWIPNSVKYHSAQWDALFDTENPSLSSQEKKERAKRLKLYNRILELKQEMDSCLPKNATVSYRAPQMTGRFGHRFRNLREQTGGNRAALGRALRSKAQDLVVVRDDEAWMFGSNNDFNEIEEDPLENEMYFERGKIDRLPIWGVNKLKDMSLLSTDLFGTLTEYGSMAATYKAMEQVVDIFELGREVLKDRKVKEGSTMVSEKERKSESRASSRYAKFMEKDVYGINVTPPSFDRNGTLRKIANNLSSLGGRILLWGNFHGGVVNTGTGIFEMLKEAMAGENFTFSEGHKANEMYFSGILGTMMTGMSNIQRPEDKNSLWIRHWNIRSENKDFYRNQKFDTKAMSLLDNRLWEWFGHTMMLPYSSGDHYMQTIPYYAMGIHQKVYDRNGNQMSLIDAYEEVDGKEVFAIEAAEGDAAIGRTLKKLQLKEGIFKNLADIDTYEAVQVMLNKINDWFETNPELKGNTVIAQSLFDDAERKLLYDMDMGIPTTVKKLETLKNALALKQHSLTFNEDDEADFMIKCRDICNRLHGIYNTEDKVAFQQLFYGNLVMAMRGYALGMVNRRFGKSKFNVPQNKVVEGSFNTGLKMLLSALYDIDSMDNWKAVGEALLLTIPVANIFGLSNNKFGERMKADMLKAGFSEHQYYNMRRVGADFLVIESLMLLMALASPGKHSGLNRKEDEDKEKGNTSAENVFWGLLYYFAMRWNREQQAFNTPSGMWNEATSLLDYVPIGFSGSNNIWNISKLFFLTQIDQIGGPDKKNSELYYQGTKKGKYEKGDAKWKVQFLRQVPYWRSWYVLSHPYDAASGFQYGRRVRAK